MKIASRAEFWFDPARTNQDNLWDSWIKLGEEFYDAITTAPVSEQRLQIDSETLMDTHPPTSGALRPADGFAFGPICVIDYKPRTLDQDQMQTLLVHSRALLPTRSSCAA